MLTRLQPLVSVLLLFFIRNALGAVLCVDVASTNAAPPDTNWSTAATVSQDALS